MPHLLSHDYCLTCADQDMDSFWLVVGNEGPSGGPLRSIQLSDYLANIGA